MKTSIFLFPLVLATPLFASPKNSKEWEEWKKNRHHRHHGTGSGSPESTPGLPPFPTMSPTGGFGGSPTGTGGFQPTNPAPPPPVGTGGGGGSTETSPPLPSSSSSSGNSSGVISSGGISLPPGCERKGNVGIGWLPGTDEKIGDIESALGITACFDGEYAQITQQGEYSDSSMQLTPSISQLTGGKTIFVASVMPSIPLSQVDSTVAGGVANVLKQFTDKNIEVYLRFAHEMNWYVTDGTYKGSSDDFHNAWGAISSAVESNELIKMFWSPNQASSGDLQQWYPTQGRVDLVGIDIYPKSQQSFGDTYGDFCQAFSTAKNLPFVIGETGAGPDLKEYWLGQVAAGDSSACPNYLGFSWFDYNKEADFRVVDGSDIAKQVLGGGS